MELKDQVCTREQSLLLKNFGVRQDSAFGWVMGCDLPVLNGRYSDQFQFAAYTVAEIGLMQGYGTAFIARPGGELESVHKADELIRDLRCNDLSAEKVNTRLGACHI